MSRASRRSSIRSKLTLAAVTPLAVVLLLVSLAASYLINAWVVEQAQKKVRNDLNAAREILRHEQQRVQKMVRFTAQSPGTASALQQGNVQQLLSGLEEIRQREKLDILSLADAEGKLLWPNLQRQPKPPITTPEFVRAALENDQFIGTVLIGEFLLRHESPQLAARAQVLDQRNAKIPRERRGMFLLSASAIRSKEGELLGCLYGGIMLNNNLSLVDRIQELVYGQESFEGIAVGSATIFLDRLRVATTIRHKNGQRALGTRVSDEVAEAVLKAGEPWLARAHVVNNWYLTAYEPIFDHQGNAIGALYVGMLETPFVALKTRSYLILLGLLLLGCGLGGLIARLLARRLARPLLELASSAEKIADGEREVSLPQVGQDEIGHLTDAFARMTGALKQSDDQLQSLNRQLEKKVAERTALLEEKSLQLIKTQEELLRQEKLAAIGSLASGVAHEINNPAAIIRGNVEILQMSMTRNAPEQEELREIMKQVERVSLITQNMLSFAGRQDLHQEQVALDRLLEDILAQVSHQVPLGEVRIELELIPDLPRIPGDKERLRQVFTNIILNALQALAGQGSLHISAQPQAEQLIISIRDSGPGIPEELREKIFNPFFTTKRQGTGLGLSVSYGIIQAHGGQIEMRSAADGGSEFLLSLPRRKPNGHN